MQQDVGSVEGWQWTKWQMAAAGRNAADRGWCGLLAADDCTGKPFRSRPHVGGRPAGVQGGWVRPDRAIPEEEAGDERMQQDVAAVEGDGIDAAPLRCVLMPPAQLCASNSGFWILTWGA